jgi:hypothetical protein
LIVAKIDLNIRSYIVEDNVVEGFKIFRFERPFKLKEAIRREKKVAQWTVRTKNVTMKDDKRLWFGDEFYNQGNSSKPKRYNMESLFLFD